jgi:hypothetical protein
VPAFLKLPISSFFFVSTDTTGSPRPCAARTVALMDWNWASRSAWLEPSSALRLPWREKPSFRSSARIVSIPTGKPIDVSSVASFSRLFDTQTRGRIGSPRVSGSTNRRNASRSAGSLSPRACRPPPLRRMRPVGKGAASKSSSPRLIVERASPVTLETSASPPRPAARTSAAANIRRPRSSSFLPNVSHRTRIAAESIIHTIYTTEPS